MSCCVRRIDGQPAAGTGGAGSTVFPAVEYEVDFSAEPNQVIATGPIAIGGLSWTALAVAGQTFQLVNGTGLVYDVNGSATSTQFTTSTHTAAQIWIDLASVYTALGLTLGATLRCEMYVSAQNIGTDTAPYYAIANFGASGTPVAGASTRALIVRRRRLAGVQSFSVVDNLGESFAYQVTPTVIGWMQRVSGNLAAIAGTWAGSWPSPQYQLISGAVTLQPWALSRFAIAFATGGAASVMSVTVERMRFVGWQP